jgi:hypothetical protein
MEIDLEKGRKYEICFTAGCKPTLLDYHRLLGQVDRKPNASSDK